MTEKLIFNRSMDGVFNFSENKLRRLTRALREQAGAGHSVPQSLMDAASHELIRATYEIAETRKLDFGAATRIVVRERPSLLWLTRGTPVRDGSHDADMEVDDDDL